MEVIDAIDLVVKVHGEGYPIQTVVADAAAEATRVVGVAHGLQDLKREGNTKC